jgi:hypothetical protein
MKNIFKNIIALMVLGIGIFIFRDLIKKAYFVLQDKYFPCSRVITYSIGTIDDNFGVSKKDFLEAIKKGEDMWEISTSKDLFSYKEKGGEIIVSLLYDNRQKNTEKLKIIDDSIQNNKISYNGLRAEVDGLEAIYKEKKYIIDVKISTFEARQNKYEKDVSYWNNKGGAPKDVYNSLSKEQKILESSVLEINKLQTELNIYANKINSLAPEINKTVLSVNDKVNDYNSVGNELGKEFEEGLYYADRNSKKIEIYQFESKEKLERVLMHEFGHALSLDHIDNPSAIMYRLNNGVSLIPTEDDIDAVRVRCGLTKSK